MDLLAMDLLEKRKKLKVTILHREGGTWHPSEVSRLVNGLMTEVSQQRDCPEYLLLFGHYTKEQTLEALLGGQAYTVSQVTGIDSKELPFRPPWVA